ncbi:MAG TPA: FliH/SctL family protein [bacterium]|nr:FliH/SctL family protein [bacterium]
MINEVVRVNEEVIGISCDEGTAPLADSPGSEAEPAREEHADAYQDLPLSEFERSMAKLQDQEEDEEAENLGHIISQLEENYSREREHIYNSGFTAGIEAGKKEFEQRFQKDIRAFEQIINAIDDSRWRLQKEAELGLLNLALQITRHIIQAEISIDREKIAHIVKETLTYAKNLEVVSLELHPEDYSYITEQSTVLEELPDGVKFKKDASMARGGCVVHTNMETIDAKIETKLTQLAEELYHNMTEEG